MGLQMIVRNDLKCPTCGTYDLKQAYQEQANGEFTTREYRELHKLKADKFQQLMVPSKDDTWFICNMCGSEFDGDGNLYLKKKLDSEKPNVVRIYPEICCGICNEVWHNHFDCPVCKCQTGTDVYGNFDNEVTEVVCEKCKSQFKVVSSDGCSQIEIRLKGV